MDATARRFLRVADMLAVIGARPPGHFGHGCTDRRPLLWATLAHCDTLLDLGFRLSTGEVLDSRKLPIRYCESCLVPLAPAVMDGFGVLSASTFPRCSACAF